MVAQIRKRDLKEKAYIIQRKGSENLPSKVIEATFHAKYFFVSFACQLMTVRKAGHPGQTGQSAQLPVALGLRCEEDRVMSPGVLVQAHTSKQGCVALRNATIAVSNKISPFFLKFLLTSLRKNKLSLDFLWTLIHSWHMNTHMHN